MSVQRRWKIPLQFKTRTTVVVFVLLSFCASIFPIPLPAPVNSSEQSGEAYPCQSCACGCKSAEHCWLNCCCHTHQEKLEWAERNGVSPPGYFLELLDLEHPAADSVYEKAVCVQPLHSQSCCSTSMKKSCCSASKAVCKTASADICEMSVCAEANHQDSTGKTVNSNTEESLSTEESSPNFVIRALALKCAGQSSALHLLPWMALSKPQIFSFTERVHSSCYPTSSCYNSRTLEPPVPPPKISSC